MLQKSIIALSTVFALSACGGSLDLGPGTSPPENGNGNGENGNGNGNGEPGESQIWTYMNFNEEEDVASWAHRCIEGCDATAELSWNSDEEVLSVMPEWASDADHLEIYTPIEEISNMEGGNASAWVFVTEDYFNDGNVTMQLLLTTATGAQAYTKPVSPEQAGWNRVSAWEMQAGTAEEHEEEDMEGIDYGTFAWHDDNFVLTDVNEFGIQFAANGKAVDVDGALWIDNVLLTPGSAFAPLLVDITEGWFSKGAWNIEGDEAADVVYGEGFVSLQVDNPAQQLVKPVHGPGSFGGAELIFTLSFDQEYIDSSDGFQPFGQVFNDTDEGYLDDDEVGGDWGCWTGNTDTADEEFTVTCTLNDEELFELSDEQYMLVGVQSQTDGVQGTMRIHRVEIAGASTPAPDSGLAAAMDSGWRVSNDDLNLQYTEEGVSYNPVAEDDQLLYDFAGPLDFEGGTYDIVFQVDQAFIDSGADVQPIIQGNPDFSVGDWGCYVGNGVLVAGENEVSCDISGGFEFDEDGGVQVGVQVKGSNIEGTLTINSLVVNP